MQTLERFHDACEVAAEDLTIYRRFRKYGVSLRGVKRLGDACNAGAGSVALSCDLYERDTEQYRETFPLCLHYYSISLRRAGKFHDTCKSGKDATALFCILYDHDPDQYHSKLANIVCNCDVLLQGRGGPETRTEQHFALFSTNYGTLSRNWFLKLWNTFVTTMEIHPSHQNIEVDLVRYVMPTGVA